MRWSELLLTALLVKILCIAGVRACQQDEAVTCGQCIQADSSCSWCSRKGFLGPRCGSKDKLEEAGCSTSEIESPNTEITTVRNDPVTDGVNGFGAIQVQPQRVHLRLRPKEKKTVKLTFRAARNYPVDLYFLFDLSYTMSDHKNDLARFAETLATEIGSISSNYQLGFGCFQDKVVDPFTYTIPPKLQLPHANSTSPFGFIHKLNLTKEVKEFIRVVREANVTANVDAPEGGFDAIMQVAVCPNIGWRRSSRRLLIYSSDSGFHMAGDGRLGGIVVPNDGQCHLGPDGSNLAENDQDYPSVGQIAEKLRDEDISLIFAIVRSNNNGDARRDYDRLSTRLEGSSVETMDNSNNVVQIVKEKYEALISKVKINTAQPSDVSVTIRSDCNTDVKLPRDNCTGLTIGRAVEFEIDIQVTECPANPADRKKVVVVSPKNINENLTIEIDMLCECPCELPDAVEANSSSCTEGNGTLACGICRCNPGRAGHMCQCALNDLGDDMLGTGDCISPRDNTTCSNNGECRCGQCQCDTGFSGRYCQCRATACRNRDCGAGTCECGKCVCDEGYTGEFCDCTLSQDNCRHPGNPEVLCSGFGGCQCGRCICPLGYIGSHCEICATCQSSCESYLQCANCLVTAQTEPSLSCAQQCHGVMDISLVKEAPEEGWCTMPVEDGCQVKFAIGGQGQSNVTITVLQTKVCPEPPNVVAIIAGVIGGILILGLIFLLLWKLITSWYDRMEYARFKEDMGNMKWAHEDNPIYKGATSTFHNPLLGSQDD